jgi:hypothetical protein
MNMSDNNQELGGETTMGCCKPIARMALTDDMETPTQKTQGLCKQLQHELSGATVNLKTREAWRLEEFISEFQEIFTVKSDDYKQTDRVYHCINNGNTHLMSVPL